MESKHEIRIDFRHRCEKSGTGVMCPNMCIACYIEQLQSQLAEAALKLKERTEKPEIPDITRKPFECDSDYEARLIRSFHSLEAALKGFSERFCLNHAATLSGDRLKRSDGSCEMCALQTQLSEARSQIEVLEKRCNTFLRGLEAEEKESEFLEAKVAALEAQLADYGKPVTDDEWNFDDELLPTPALKEMFKRMRATFDDLLRHRTQSRQGA